MWSCEYRLVHSAVLRFAGIGGPLTSLAAMAGGRNFKDNVPISAMLLRWVPVRTWLQGGVLVTNVGLCRHSMHQV